MLIQEQSLCCHHTFICVKRPSSCVESKSNCVLFFSVTNHLIKSFQRWEEIQAAGAHPSTGTGRAQVPHGPGFMSLVSSVCLADPASRSMTGIHSEQKGQSELTCVFDPFKQNSRHCLQQTAQWLFCSRRAQVKACQSWGKWGWKERGGETVSCSQRQPVWVLLVGFNLLLAGVTSTASCAWNYWK